MSYTAPIKEMQFVLEHVASLGQLADLPGGHMVDRELVGQILTEAGSFAAEELAPLNARGDQEGSRLENGVVRTPTGWREAYRKYVDGGWNGVPFDEEHGGQGVPWLVATAVQESGSRPTWLSASARS